MDLLHKVHAVTSVRTRGPIAMVRRIEKLGSGSGFPLWLLVGGAVILLLYFASLESRLATRKGASDIEALKQGLQSIDGLGADVLRLQEGLAEVEKKLDATAQAQLPALGSARAAGVPVGTVVAFAGDGRKAVPAGWLLCDGAEVSREQYPELFRAIGTRYGAGDGASTFHLPDYRGLFLRGVDDPDGRGGMEPAGRDPEAAQRTNMRSGEVEGDMVGTVQGDATRAPNNPFVTEADGAHEHVVLWSRDGGGGLPGVRHAFQSSANRYGKTTIPRQEDERQPEVDGVHIHAVDPSTGDKETRPKNASVNWIIKAASG